jgi:DNA-binding MarR family transcriptional regulator
MPEDHDGLAAELRRGATRLARRLHAERTTRELSLGKLAVLADLIEGGPVCAGDLAAAQNQRPQALTRLLAELAADDLVTRTRGERDHRKVLIEITGKGRDALRRDMTNRDAWLSTALAGFTETEREVLRLAGRLMNMLAKAPATLRLPDLKTQRQKGPV